MDTGLRGKVILITGSSGGIGSECARMFSKEGVKLALHGYTNMEAVHQLQEELSGEILPVQADLTKEQEVKELFDRIKNNYGKIDVVIANAGVWPAEDTPIENMTVKRWQDTMDVDAKSVFLTARGFLRSLREQDSQHGSLVLIGSTAAVFGEEGHADYAAAKAAVSYGLTRSLKNEIVRIAPKGRVNCICPGWTKTPIASSGPDSDEHLKKALQTRAIKEIARPKDVARTAVFLSSDILAGHITGEAITVSGGMEGRVLHDHHEINLDEA